MQRLLSNMRSAVERYDMIENGDKIAIGLSGGKDSVALLAAMARLREFYPKGFELFAVTLDPCFSNTEADYSLLEELCRRLSVPYVIRRTELAKIIFENRQEKNPCSLCARMRRGILHDEAKKLDCNKIALGHHLDDVAETFLMNLLNGGTIGSFSPVTYLSRKDLYMIRPMVFAKESDCMRVVKNTPLPIVKSKCPADGCTERQEVKQLLNSFDSKYGDVRKKILGAMQRKGINGY